MPCFEIVAHRGIPNESPENTLLAYQKAIELGADAVDWDVNDERALQTSVEQKIPRICTDQFQMAYDFRNKIS